MWEQRQKEFIHLLLISRQMSSHFLGSRASVRIPVAWKDKCHNHKCPRILPFPSAFHAEHSVTCWASCWSVWVSCPIYVPSQPFTHHQCTGLSEKWLGRKSLMLWKWCSATARILVIWHCFSHKCKAQPHTSCYEESQCHPGRPCTDSN